MIERGINNRDPLLLKIVRNISIYTHHVQVENISRDEEYNPLPHLLRSLWGAHIIPLVRLLLDSETTNEVVLETLGILSNLTIYDLDTVRLSWLQLCQDYPLLDFCQRLLLPGMTQTDIVLEVVVLLGQMSLDTKLAPLLASGKILQSLESVLADGLNTNHVSSNSAGHGHMNNSNNSRRGGNGYNVSTYHHNLSNSRGVTGTETETDLLQYYENSDPELILQTLFTLYRFIRLEDTAAIMLQYTQLTLEIMDVLKHPNPEVRYMADKLLGSLLELDRKIVHFSQKQQKQKNKNNNSSFRGEDGKDDDSDDDNEDAGNGGDSNFNTTTLSSSLHHENFGVLGQRIIRKRFEAHNREWFDYCEREEKEHRINNSYSPSTTSTTPSTTTGGRFGIGHAKFYTNDDDDMDGGNDTDSSFEREHILNGLQASSYHDYLNQDPYASTSHTTTTSPTANNRGQFNSDTYTNTNTNTSRGLGVEDEEGSVNGVTGFPHEVHDMYMQMGNQMMDRYSSSLDTNNNNNNNSNKCKEDGKEKEEEEEKGHY